MSVGIETAKLLYRNLNALTWVMEPAQHDTLSQTERNSVLETIQATARAGRKLAEAVLVDALTENHKSGAGGVEGAKLSDHCPRSGTTA